MNKLNDNKLRTCLRCKRLNFLQRFYFTYKICDKCEKDKKIEKQAIFKNTKSSIR